MENYKDTFCMGSLQNDPLAKHEPIPDIEVR